MQSPSVPQFSQSDIRIARARLVLAGKTAEQWAEENGFAGKLVAAVLSGRRRCLRGNSHRIAVALGLKPGDGECTLPPLPTQADGRFHGVDQGTGRAHFLFTSGDDAS